MDLRVRRRLSRAGAVVTVTLAFLGALLWLREERRREWDSRGAHLLSQLTQALESYHEDYAAYPPSLQALSTRPYTEPRHVDPPRQPDPDPMWGLLHYRYPGLHRAYDLWMEDSRGDPERIRNWP